MKTTERIRLSVEVDIEYEPGDRELAVCRAMANAAFWVVSGYHPRIVTVKTTGNVHEITTPQCPANPKSNP